jgi:hypothetical protein
MPIVQTVRRGWLLAKYTVVLVVVFLIFAGVYSISSSVRDFFRPADTSGMVTGRVYDLLPGYPRANKTGEMEFHFRLENGPSFLPPVQERVIVGNFHVTLALLNEDMKPGTAVMKVIQEKQEFDRYGISWVQAGATIRRIEYNPHD